MIFFNKPKIFHVKGLSLNELLEKYGIGARGFENDLWWQKEPFSKEHPEAGDYEVDFKSKHFNMTADQQKELLKKDFEFPHPAIIASIILSEYHRNQKRYLQKWYTRTNSCVYDQNEFKEYIFIGMFDWGGLKIGSGWPEEHNELGIASIRKI